MWKKAEKKLVDCDVLRVIGCSLRNEDVALLSLIFTSQLSKGVNSFSIEFIDFDDNVNGTDSKPGIISRLSFLTRPRSFTQLDHYESAEDSGKNPFESWVRMLMKSVSIKNEKIYQDPILKKNLKFE